MNYNSWVSASYSSDLVGCGGGVWEKIAPPLVTEFHISGPSTGNSTYQLPSDSGHAKTRLQRPQT